MVVFEETEQPRLRSEEVCCEQYETESYKEGEHHIWQEEEWKYRELG